MKKKTTHIPPMGLPVWEDADVMVDLSMPPGAKDPYFDTCPHWCACKQGGHTVETCEAERIHVGDNYTIPIRSMPFRSSRTDGGNLVQGAIEVYLTRPAQQPRADDLDAY